jgi:hypothetical protein
MSAMERFMKAYQREYEELVKQGYDDASASELAVARTQMQRGPNKTGARLNLESTQTRQLDALGPMRGGVAQVANQAAGAQKRGGGGGMETLVPLAALGMLMVDGLGGGGGQGQGGSPGGKSASLAQLKRPNTNFGAPSKNSSMQGAPATGTGEDAAKMMDPMTAAVMTAAGTGLEAFAGMQASGDNETLMKNQMKYQRQDALFNSMQQLAMMLRRRNEEMRSQLMGMYGRG